MGQRPGRGPLGSRALRQALDEDRAQPGDELLAEGHQVAALGLESVEDVDARKHVAIDEGRR